MGILDAFKRKKKKKDEWPEIGKPADVGAYGPSGTGLRGIETPPTTPGVKESPVLPGMPPASAAEPAPPMRPKMPETVRGPGIEALKKEMDTLSYKVDSLKSTLDLINQRLASIEEAIKGQRGSVY
ncbi:hypothetical protein GF374_00450 [Candidatus Woesearchaeota archaeon]|nr:hypothetical protein [Candidatus Woesearchaeota archaeon]